VKFRVPHTFVILFVLTALAAGLTHFIPAGRYERVEVSGRKVVDAASYHEVEPDPATVGDVALAYPRGLLAVADLVMYIFIIGGAFGVVTATGAVDAAIGLVVRAGRGRGPWVIASLMLVFSLGGATIGMAEETLPFIPTLVILARRLGYDEITGASIALVGAGAGFSGAFLNPFTVVVGQRIAEVPKLSGMGYRMIVWVVVTTIAIAYVLRWAARVRTAPAVDLADDAPGFAPAGPTRRHLAVLAVVGLGLAALVFGAMRLGWGLLELSGLFVAITVATGLCGGLGPNGTAVKFVEGAAGIASGALVVGLARGVLVIFDDAHTTDTILHGMAGVVTHLPAQVTIVGIYAVQVALSYIVPSGSGQAALSLPILAPLADLVGVTRQTSVLAYQFGDGFSNIFTPTSGYFMAALDLAKVPWTRWARFMLPLQLLWLSAGLVLLLIAHAMHWGPV
jgi:uncharacterized ion transporter superfamily protein YfcC